MSLAGMHKLLGSLIAYTLIHLRGDRGIPEAVVAPERLAQLESGHLLPDPEEIEAILKALDCSERQAEDTLLFAAEALRETRRANRVKKIGLAEFDDVVTTIVALQHGNAMLLDALERLAGNEALRALGGRRDV